MHMRAFSDLQFSSDQPMTINFGTVDLGDLKRQKIKFVVNTHIKVRATYKPTSRQHF